VTRTGSSKPLAQIGTILSMVAQAPTLSTQTFWFFWKTAFAMRPRHQSIQRCIRT
jgi:hypothetical protein